MGELAHGCTDARGEPVHGCTGARGGLAHGRTGARVNACVWPSGCARGDGLRGKRAARRRCMRPAQEEKVCMRKPSRDPRRRTASPLMLACSAPRSPACPALSSRPPSRRDGTPSRPLSVPQRRVVRGWDALRGAGARAAAPRRIPGRGLAIWVVPLGGAAEPRRTPASPASAAARDGGRGEEDGGRKNPGARGRADASRSRHRLGAPGGCAPVKMPGLFRAVAGEQVGARRAVLVIERFDGGALEQAPRREGRALAQRGPPNGGGIALGRVGRGRRRGHRERKGKPFFPRAGGGGRRRRRARLREGSPPGARERQARAGWRKPTARRNEASVGSVVRRRRQREVVLLVDGARRGMRAAGTRVESSRHARGLPRPRCIRACARGRGTVQAAPRPHALPRSGRGRSHARPVAPRNAQGAARAGRKRGADRASGRRVASRGRGARRGAEVASAQARRGAAKPRGRRGFRKRHATERSTHSLSNAVPSVACGTRPPVCVARGCGSQIVSLLSLLPPSPRCAGRARPPRALPAASGRKGATRTFATDANDAGSRGRRQIRGRGRPRLHARALAGPRSRRAFPCRLTAASFPAAAAVERCMRLGRARRAPRAAKLRHGREEPRRDAMGRKRA